MPSDSSIGNPSLYVLHLYGRHLTKATINLNGHLYLRQADTIEIQSPLRGGRIKLKLSQADTCIQLHVQKGHCYICI